MCPPSNGDVAMSDIRVPLLGTVHFVKDALGILCSCFIIGYWIYGTSSIGCVLMPYYLESRIPMPIVALFLVSAIMTISSFTKAALTNPGRVKLPAEQAIVTDKLPYCVKCRCVKPPCAHHCRRCRQCVVSMDHHCPWINNCVGEDNRHAFILLVFYTVMLCATILGLVISYLFYMQPCHSCDKASFCVLHGQGLLRVTGVMSALMLCSSFGLLSSQHISLILNTTSMQFMFLQREWLHSGTWDMAFMARRRSCHVAYQELCGPRSMWLWLLPCFKRPRVINYDTIFNPDYTV